MYTRRQLNYFRVCHVATNIVPDALRSVFKKEWDAHFKHLGQWQDTFKNSTDFYNQESPRNQIRNRNLLNIMRNGDRSEWDCTCLFYAILYSDSVGANASSAVKTSVNDLREFRNKVFAHSVDGILSKADFKVAIKKVITSFKSLSLATASIKKIKNQKSFPTDEVRILETKLNLERNKVSSLEKAIAEPKAFAVFPPKPSHEIIGCQNQVERIEKEMQRLRNENGNSVTIMYLSGNPGCGKSQIAKQVAERFFEDLTEVTKDPKEVKFVMTLNARSPTSLLQSYAELATRVGCTDNATVIMTSKVLNDEQKLSQLKTLIFPKLPRYSSWLIIVDNVISLKSVCQHLPLAGEKYLGRGQVLITTQDSSSITFDPLTSHFSLSAGMENDDAILALSKISGLPREKDIEQEVAKQLDFQPLALACAAVYMRRLRDLDTSTTWKVYLDKLKDGKREATEKEYEKTNQSYSWSMTKAVSLAVERETASNAEIRVAFQFMSLLAPESLSLDYVVRYVMKCIPGAEEHFVKSAITVSSLILVTDDKSDVWIHQVVYNSLHDFAFSRGKNEDVNVTTSAVVFFSDLDLFNPNSTSSIAVTGKLVIHVASLIKKVHGIWKNQPIEIEQTWIKKGTEMISCLNNIGRICYAHRNLEESKLCFEMCVEAARKMNGDTHPSVFGPMEDLGNVLADLGQYQDALECYKKVQAMKEVEFGENSIEMAATLYNYGCILKDLGKYEASRVTLEKALIIEEMFYGENDVEVATTLRNLGATLCYLGEYCESKNRLEKALAIKESVLGKNHPQVASILSCLGITLRFLGYYEASKQRLLEALTINENVYGKNHPIVATTLLGLAVTLRFLGDYDGSKDRLEKALKIKEKVHGKSHLQVANILSSLGVTHRFLGNYEKAKDLLEKALAIQKGVYGQNHPVVASVVSNLGVVLDDLGHYEKSRYLLENAQAIHERTYGANHPIVLTVLTNLGVTLCHLGHYKVSKDLLERAVIISDRIYGKYHSNMANTLSNLGVTLYHLSEYEASKTQLEKALAIQETVYGKNHPQVALTLCNLGVTLRHLGQLKASKVLLERALAIQECEYNEDHPVVGTTLFNLGVTFSHLAEYEHSKDLLQKALAIQEGVYGENHSMVATTLYNLGVTLQFLGQYKAAKECLQKQLVINECVYGTNCQESFTTLKQLAIILDILGLSVAAKSCREEAMAIEKNVAKKGSQKKSSDAEQIENDGKTETDQNTNTVMAEIEDTSEKKDKHQIAEKEKEREKNEGQEEERVIKKSDEETAETSGDKQNRQKSSRTILFRKRKADEDEQQQKATKWRKESKELS